MIQSSRFRLILFGFVIIAGFGMLLSRLWYLQFQKQEEYAKKLPGTKEVLHRFPGPRGRILDRNGVELARNRSVRQIGFDLGAIVQFYKDGHKGAFPKFEYDPAKDPETDIVTIVNETVISPLAQLDLALDFHFDDKKTAERQEWEDHLRKHYRTFKGEVPFNYVRGVSWENFAKFAEHTLNLPGVNISERFLREYPFGALTGHLVGYVKLFDRDIPAEDKGKFKGGFYEGDDRGVAGLEKTLDKYLRGKPGLRTLLINEHGRLERELEEKFQDARPGDDVYLTIDIRAQYAAEMALREAGIGRGSVVVQAPDTGEVISMVAVPNYDPNKFIPGITTADYKIYTDDPTIPLLNRAINSFTPGSIFKVPVALSGFLVPGQTRSYYNCDGAVEYGGKPIHCWIAKQGGSHGSQDLVTGLKNSCNCFFFQYGNDAGIDNINKMCTMLGLGMQTGIELEGESAGLVPGKTWLKSNGGGVWGSAATAFVSIGQGQVVETPLQMSCMAVTVANGGKAYYPTLVHHRVDSVKQSTTFKPHLRTDLLKESIPSRQIELVRKGMWSVVNAPGGTGKNFKSDLPAIAQHGGGAGKTGTAQAWREHSTTVRDDNTWFMCFAPYDSPKVAAVILVQGGKSGGSTSAPIAKRVVEQTIAILDGSYKIDLATIAKLTEAKGHFKLIDAVSYGNGPNVPKSTPEDDADIPDDEPPEHIIRPKAIPLPVAVPAEAPTLENQGNVAAPKARIVDGPQYQLNPGAN